MEMKFSAQGPTTEIWKYGNMLSDEHGRKISTKTQILGPRMGETIYSGQVNANFGPMMGQATVTFELGVYPEDALTIDLARELFSKYDDLSKAAVEYFAKKVEERRRDAVAPVIIDPSKGMPPPIPLGMMPGGRKRPF
jgi:hypothetical protein